MAWIRTTVSVIVSPKRPSDQSNKDPISSGLNQRQMVVSITLVPLNQTHLVQHKSRTTQDDLRTTLDLGSISLDEQCECDWSTSATIRIFGDPERRTILGTITNSEQNGFGQNGYNSGYNGGREENEGQSSSTSYQQSSGTSTQASGGSSREYGSGGASGFGANGFADNGSNNFGSNFGAGSSVVGAPGGAIGGIGGGLAPGYGAGIGHGGGGRGCVSY
ncbi:hypothetical protein H4Q26_014715 [Puccinia striiformis f. sp. tritici PST-130]|nr:hypothetical protein H4Q26_014715 [Puccinia striiformis f. sp. tritici PST-130]